MKLSSTIILYIFIMAFSKPIFAQNPSLFTQAFMQDGPYIGHELDTSTIRGLVFLNHWQISPYAFVANVSHDGKFYVAKIPIEGIKDASFIYEKFTTMMGGHADIVYHFDEKAPVELVYEIVPAKNKDGYELAAISKPIKLNDLVLTAEAVHTVGTKPELVEGGLTNKFAIAYRLTSVPQRLFNPVLVERRVTTSFDIPFDSKEATLSFWKSIIEFSKTGMSTNYNLVSNNCITSAIRALSNGLSDQEKADFNADIARATAKLTRIHIENLDDLEVKKIIREFFAALKINGVEIRASPIHENGFFMKYLSPSQQEDLLPKFCSNLFAK